MRILRSGALVFLLAACSPASTALAHLEDQVLARATYTGVYEFGLERESFRPCGAPRSWWVGGTPSGLRKSMGQRTLVTVRGRVSPEGEYGHMGRYPRQIVITRVVSSSADPNAACPAS